MQRINRLLMWRGLLAGAIFDGVLAFGLAYYFRSEYDSFSWVNVLIAFLVVQAVGLFWSVRGLVYKVVSIKLVEPKLVQESYLEGLRSCGFPPPSPRYPARYDYLLAIAEDPLVAPVTRVRAMSVYARNESIKQMRGLVASVILDTAADAATKRYDEELAGVASDHWDRHMPEREEWND